MAGKPFFRRRWFLIACGLVLLYTLVGFFLAPVLLKSQIESRLPAVLHRNVSVQDVQINPYVLSLRIAGFRITEPDGQPFASLDEFFINVQLSSLFQRSFNFKEISLTKPAVAVTLHQGGKTNFDDLLGGRKEQAPPEPSKPPKVKIEKLQIDDGSVTFADLTRTPTFETLVHPIELSLTDFSTNPDAESPYSFSAHTETGATLSWSGAFSVNPLRSNGLVTVNGIQLKNFSPYYADFAHFEVTDGEAALRAEYRLDASSGPLALEVHHAGVEVKRLTLKAPDTGEAVVTLASLTIAEAEADLLKRAATVDAVSLSDGTVLARRRQDGTINLLSLLRLSPKGEPSPAPQVDAVKTPSSGETQEPWHFAVNQFLFANFSVTAEDALPPTPAKLTLDRINLTLNGLAFPDRTPIAMETSVRWNQSGTIAANGTLRHSPVFADLHVAVNNFDLRPFQPYIEEHAKIELTSGAASLQGHVVYGAQETGAPMLRFTGAFSLDQIAAVDTISSKSVVAWDSLALKEIHADVSPTAVAVDEIRLKKLKSSVVVASDGRLNVANLRRTPAEKDADTPPENSKAEVAKPARIPMSVKAVVLNDSTVSFTDQSVQPNYAAEIRKLNGRIQGLSSQSGAKAKVELAGRLDGHAPLSISGQINPLSTELFANLEFSLKSFDLPPLSPYTAKFVGYPLQKGKLSADLRYTVADHKLDGANVVLVDQLTLGQHTDSPDATSLPVKLAIAILKDRRGEIHLDVPVSGNLNDPQFGLGKVIWGAFVNILQKVATSPFALVGAIVGGGGEELRVIDFAPGSTEIIEAATQKLDKLAKALVERPGLDLEISAQADPKEDRPALAKDKLRRSFIQQKRKAMKAKNPSLEEEVSLQDREYDRMVQLTYAELVKAEAQTPSSSNAVAMGVPAPPDDAFQEPEKKSGFLEFLSRLNPFKSSRSTKKGSFPSVSGEGNEAGSSGFTIEEMERRLIDKQTVTEEDFNELKQQRAKTVQDYLLKAGDLSVDRLFIVAPSSQDKTGGQSQVTLALK